MTIPNPAKIAVLTAMFALVLFAKGCDDGGTLQPMPVAAQEIHATSQN